MLVREQVLRERKRQVLKCEKLEAELRKAQERLRDMIVADPAALFTLSVADNRTQGISWTGEDLQHILGYPGLKVNAMSGQFP